MKKHNEGVDRALHDAALANDVKRVGELIAAGADVDAPGSQGFTPLHLAAQQYAVDAARALLDAGATVDARNVHGNTPLFVATFNSLGRGEMIELLRQHGAHPDTENNYAQTPRGLAHLIGNYDVKQFFEDWAVRHEAEARAIRQADVPPRGQAATVQEELMRAIEKLRDEAQRNGNSNWDDGHRIFAEYVRDTLLGSKIFDEPAVEEIERDAARLLDFEYPETADEPFDRLTDRAVEWARAHPDPVPHTHNPALHR